jgi:outer membrane protein assembly factor BamB
MQPTSSFQRTFALIWLLLAVGPCLGQWPQFGGVDRDFRASEELGTGSAKWGEWSIELGLGDAAPIVDQNRIFVTEAAYTDDGQEAMQVRCIDPWNGSTCWATMVEEKSDISQDISDSYPVRPLASPVASANRIVVVSYGGVVTCLDQLKGTIAWSHDLVSEFNAKPLQFGWASSPWSDAKNVIVACGGAEALVIAFNLGTGEVAWKTSSGEAAFGSFSEVLFDDGSKHLCYVGSDLLLGFDSVSGRELWSYPLPKPGVTNAVTPISLPHGQLLVAGQGFESSRQLQIENANGAWKVNEVWVSKNTPFYCNWLVDASTHQVFGYNSNVLAGVDLGTGETNWKVRGWTDANFAIQGDWIVGIRGDGFLAKCKITKNGMAVSAGSRVVNDRVWAPPVLAGDSALIRGRTTLSAVALGSLRSTNKLPSGTTIDSMSAMYGQKHESIVAMLTKASTTPNDFQYDDYQLVVADRSVRIDDKEYQTLLDSLEKAQNRETQIRITENWCKLEPESIVAFDKLIELLRRQGDYDRVDSLLAQRMVNIEIEVGVPKTTDPDAKVYLTGNAAAVMSWKADGVLLKRSDEGRYGAKLRVPQGNFEFKLTCGDWDSVEVRSDGRSISNRRRRIVQPVAIQLEVQAWKNEALRKIEKLPDTNDT